MKNKFFVIEGLDGSGKSTQIEMLVDLFEHHKIKFKYIHFPRTDQPNCYGDLISMFLRGEFGNKVDPYLIALMFAADRNDAKSEIQEWLNDGFLVFADRYYYSNIAFQGAKIDDLDKKMMFIQWLKKLEIDCNHLPIPALTLYLKVPFNFIEDGLTKKRQLEKRSYLGDAKDIHENDLTLQINVNKEYESLLKTENNLLQINCLDDKGEMMPPDKIHLSIVKSLFDHKILKESDLKG